MNFATLVKNAILLEQAQNQEEVTANNAAGYLLNIYPKIAQEYKQKYNNYEQFRNAFPTEQDYKALIYNAANAAVRTVKDSDRYANIRDIFPVLDLVGLIVQNYSKAMGGDEKKADAAYNDFVTRLKAAKGAPIEYEPLSPWAKAVKDDFFGGRQKIDIGRLKLESPEFQNQSLYFVIQKLFQLRLSGRAGILKLDDPKIPDSSQKFIDKFLFEPNSYISGAKPMPEQNIKDLYNDVTPDLILEVAKNAYSFFEQQADVNLGGIKALEGKQNEAFKLFITNKIDWGLFSTNLQTNSLTTFSSLIHDLLNEMSNKGSLAAYQQGYQAAFPSKPSSQQIKSQVLKNVGQTRKGTQSSKYSEDPLQQTSEKPDPFKDANGKSDYSLGKVIAAKAQVPAANNLYNSLVKLADFLRKETEADWKGVFNALGQIAKGLSMGVQTVGGKR